MRTEVGEGEDIGKREKTWKINVPAMNKNHKNIKLKFCNKSHHL